MTSPLSWPFHLITWLASAAASLHDDRQTSDRAPTTWCRERKQIDRTGAWFRNERQLPALFSSLRKFDTNECWHTHLNLWSRPYLLRLCLAIPDKYTRRTWKGRRRKKNLGTTCVRPANRKSPSPKLFLLSGSTRSSIAWALFVLKRRKEKEEIYDLFVWLCHEHSTARHPFFGEETIDPP